MAKSGPSRAGRSAGLSFFGVTTAEEERQKPRKLEPSAGIPRAAARGVSGSTRFKRSSPTRPGVDLREHHPHVFMVSLGAGPKPKVAAALNVSIDVLE